MANLTTYTAEEVLNKVIYNNTSLTTYTMDEGLNAVLDAGNDRLKLNLQGGTISGNVTITGELTVEGATTTIESTTVQVADKTFELAVTDTPSDATSDGGGIILKGTTDKTILWNDANDWWNFNQGVNITGNLNASGNVGIGETNPAVPLHITGGNLRLDHTRPMIQFEETDGTADQNWQLDVAAGVFRFQTNNNAFSSADTKVVIDQSGSVGIGTASPTNALLEVKTDDENIARFDGLQGNIDFRYGSDIEFDRAGQVYITANNASGELNFRTGGQNIRMHIDSSGNVGIGQSAPKSLLQIDGENAAGVLTISHGGASNSISDNEILGTIDFSGYDLTNTYAIGAKIQARANGNWADASTNYAGTDLEFYTQDDTTTDRFESLGTPTPRMVINKSGNVGINTNNPASQMSAGTVLEVKDSSIASLALQGAGSSRWELTSDNGDDFKVSRNGSTAITVDGSNNRVGIGLTNPSSALQVVGAFSSQIKFGTNTSVYTNMSMGTGFTVFDSIGGDSGAFDFRDDGASRMFIDSSGSVSIGANSASTKMTQGLTIYQGGNDDEIFACQSSDVAHGMTTLADTDTFFSIRKGGADVGGANIQGFADSTSGTGMHIQAAISTSADTAKTSSASGCMMIYGATKSGTNRTVLGSNQNIVVIRNDSQTRFIFDAEGSGHADVEWTTYSDSRLKLNQEQIPYGLNEINQLQPKIYDRYSGDVQNGEVTLEETSRRQIGFIAQEVKEIIPELVKDVDESESFYSLNDGKLVAVLVAALQEADDKIDALTARIEALENA